MEIFNEIYEFLAINLMSLLCYESIVVIAAVCKGSFIFIIKYGINLNFCEIINYVKF